MHWQEYLKLVARRSHTSARSSTASNAMDTDSVALDEDAEVDDAIIAPQGPSRLGAPGVSSGKAPVTGIKSAKIQPELPVTKSGNASTADSSVGGASGTVGGHDHAGDADDDKFQGSILTMKRHLWMSTHSPQVLPATPWSVLLAVLLLALQDNGERDRRNS